jgi:hypothetical protein
MWGGQAFDSGAVLAAPVATLELLRGQTGKSRSLQARSLHHKGELPSLQVVVRASRLHEECRNQRERPAGCSLHRITDAGLRRCISIQSDRCGGRKHC